MEQPSIFSLAQRTVLLVGGANDHGRALARAFLDAGARVIVVDTDAAAVVAMLPGLGANCLGLNWDAGDAGAIVATLGRSLAFGPVDALVVLERPAAAADIAPAMDRARDWIEAAARAGDPSARLNAIVIGVGSRALALPLGEALQESVGPMPGPPPAPGSRVNGVLAIDANPGALEGTALYFAGDASLLVTGAVVTIDGALAP